MSTLCDRILRYGLVNQEYPYPKDTVAGLENATVINADNVSEYVWAGASKIEWNILEDVPSVAPPWADAFIEFKIPERVYGEEVAADIARRGYGVRVKSKKLADLVSDTTEPESMRSVARQLRSNNVAWAIFMDVFFEHKKGKIYPVCRKVFGAREDGTPTALRSDHPVMDFVYPSRLFSAESDSSVVGSFGMMTIIAALTYCFCNCAKTEVVQHAPDPKMQHSYRAKTGKSLVKFHTVRIEAVNRVLRSAVGSNGDIKQALHICRGHFKDYRKSGLFGKVKGVFWWDMSVRGNADAGVVIKDYTIGKSTPHPGAVATQGV